jgi:hypothetical protein
LQTASSFATVTKHNIFGLDKVTDEKNFELAEILTKATTTEREA